MTTNAAFLTLIGYSVNDTVVTFDRVRENMKKHRGRNLLKVLNESLNQMLSRTLLTGGTTIFASLMLYLFGGDVIRGFAFIMLVGIIVGTYSSIYIASPFALMWEEWFGSARKAKAAAKCGGDAGGHGWQGLRYVFQRCAHETHPHRQCGFRGKLAVTEGREIIEMISAVFESHRMNGQRVTFPLQTRQNPLTLL